MSRPPASVTRAVTLRAATDDDRDFLVGVYGSTREAELDQVDWPPGERDAFVCMQFELQDREYRRHNPHGAFDVIEVDGQPAGRLYVDHRPTDIRIVDIALLPEFRGAGVGGHLVQAILDEAVTLGHTVSIHVEVASPAERLYERLGFVPVDVHGIYRLMEWSP